MSWPLSQDYNEAVQNPHTSFRDPDLQRAEVVTNPLGIPLPRSGSFADVYELRGPSGRWAVKCFTREVAGLRERYAAISRHLAQAQLPFIVDFTFLDQGIRISGRWYPVLKMQWVEGLTLNELVRQYADRPPMLQSLLHIWARMAARLREAGIAHADLQHGNVLLVPGSSANSLAVKLVDYDGMWVPALAGKHSGELGHACYQHPQRLADQTYSLEVDRFPLLLVATALDCLRVGGKALWDSYDSGDNLLFREADLRAPVKSPLFHELLKIGDERAARLVRQTLDALKGRLESVPLLEQLLPELSPAAAKRTTSVKVGAAQPTGVQTAETDGAALFAGVSGREDRPRSRRRRRGRGRWLVGAVVAGVAALILAGGLFGLAFWDQTKSREKTKDQVRTAQNNPRNRPAKPVKVQKDTDVKEEPSDSDEPPKEVPVAPPPTEPTPVLPAPADTPGTDAPVKPEDSKDEDKPAPPEAVKPPVEDDVVALFNGKDTTGWRNKGKGTWKVDSSGTLVGEGPDAALASQRGDFKDFTLHAELSSSADAEAYLLVRLRRTLDEPWRGMSTRIFGDKGAVWAGQADAAFTREERGIQRLQFKPGESFTLDIRVRGDAIRIHTNGQLTADCPCRPDPVGGIGLFVMQGALRVSKLEIKEVYRVEGALEGEELKVLGSSDGFPVGPQDMTIFGNDRWSGDTQLWGQPRQKGAWVDLEVPVAADGKYQMAVYLTRARDYGIVQLSLNGTPLKEPIDGFHAPEVVRTEALDLGTVELKKGRATLRIEVVDTNDKTAGLRYMWGLDCVVLKLAPSGRVPRDSVAEAREAAARAYEKACADARARLLTAFDTVLDQKSKGNGSAATRQKWMDLLKEEKDRFAGRGLIPWSQPMWPHLDRYLATLTLAQSRLHRAYDPLIAAQRRAKNQSLAAELQAELKDRLAIGVVARWRHLVNGRQGGVPNTLYSNGRINNPEGGATWTYAQGILVLRWPAANAPGGAWIDKVQVSPEGTRYSGSNNDRPERRPRITGVYHNDN